MNKYYNRVVHEFEDVLCELSENYSTTYTDALKAAEQYVQGLNDKKKFSESEKTEVLNICLELIADWFPDTSNIEELHINF